VEHAGHVALDVLKRRGGGGQVAPGGGLFHPRAGGGHARGAQHAAVACQRVGDAPGGGSIPGSQRIAHLVQFSGRAGSEQLDELTDELGIAERVLGPAQVGHNRRVEDLFS